MRGRQALSPLYRHHPTSGDRGLNANSEGESGRRGIVAHRPVLYFPVYEYAH